MENNDHHSRATSRITVLAALLGAFALYVAFAGACTSQEAPRRSATVEANMKTVIIPIEGMSGLSGAFGYGFIFSLGTSVAPLLLLLTVSAAKGRPAQGLLLAFTFGLGRGLPFLLAGVIASAMTGFTRLSAWRRTIQVVSGCALLLVSGYYVNTFVALL